MKNTKPTTCSEQSAIDLENTSRRDLADISTAAFIQGRIRGYKDSVLCQHLKRNSKSEAAHRNRVRMIFFERFDFSALNDPNNALPSALLEIVSAIKEEGLWYSPFAFEEFLLCAGALINRSAGSANTLTSDAICDIDTALHTIDKLCEGIVNGNSTNLLAH